VDGILSKRIEGTAYGGGGVRAPGGPGQIVAYIIPYNNSYFIISGWSKDLVERIKTSFYIDGFNP